MATPTTTLWVPDPHTAAKHQMLSGYLAAWFPIMVQTFRQRGVTFVDGFAGPGEYTDGSVGSPVVALRQALRPDVSDVGAPIRTVFIEKAPDRFEHLQQVLVQRFPTNALPGNVTLSLVQGGCEDVMIPALRQVGAWGAPMFVNLDGWGVDTPYSLIKAVGREQSSEVLVTFSTQWFIRFARQEDVEAGDRVFGDREWRAVAATGSPEEKKKGLLDLYRARLGSAGFPYTLIFELIDEAGHGLLLVFGTESLRGVEKMKDSMWKVDHVNGQHFRDPRDINQIAMDFGTTPDLTLLERQILSELESGRKSLAYLKKFALTETVFRSAHAVDAVKSLDEQQKVACKRARAHEDVMVELAPLRLF